MKPAPDADDARRQLEDNQRWQQEAARLAAENSNLSIALHEAIQNGKNKDETIQALRHDVTRLSSEYEALFNAYTQVSRELGMANALVSCIELLVSRFRQRQSIKIWIGIGKMPPMR